MQKLVAKLNHPAQITTVTSAFLEDLLRDVNSRCASEVRAFYKHNNDSITHTLASMWESGRRIEALKNPEYSEPKEPGKPKIQIISLLATATGRSEAILNKYGQLYRAWSSEEKRRQLLALEMANGQPLTWKHHELLMRLLPDSPTGDRSAHDKMLKEVQAKNMTVEELAQRMKTTSSLAGVRPHGGGRPLAIPTTVRGRLAKALNASELYYKNTTEIFIHEKHGFLSGVRSMPQEAVVEQAEELTNELSTLLANVTAQEEANAKMKSEIEDTIRHIQQRTAAHNEQSGKTAADSLDDADAVRAARAK